MLYGEPEDEELAAEEQAASLRVSERVLLRDDGTKLFSINPIYCKNNSQFVSSPPLLLSPLNRRRGRRHIRLKGLGKAGTVCLFHLSQPMCDPINQNHWCTLPY